MAHFYGSIRGSRGEATRCGTSGSGFRAHVRGWDLGVRIELRDAQGSDRVSVFLTAGSNGGEDIPIGDYSRADYEALLADRD